MSRGSRSRSRSGRSGGGGRSRSLSRSRSRSQSRAHSQSSGDGEHAANQHKRASSDDSGWFSGGSGSWFSIERVECKDLYQLYKECVNTFLEDRENDVYGRCSIQREEFEGYCGSKYNSLLSSWWTEKDEKRLCKEWSEFYERMRKKKPDSPEYCKSAVSVVQRACRGIKLD